MLYYPSRDKFHSPEKLKLTFEDVYLKVENETIHGQYFPVKKPKALVLFFHGNAQNLSAHFLTLSWLPELNISYFIFDYEGFGQSSGNPSPQKTVNDGMVAIDWVQKKAKKLNIPLVVYAQSLGGAIALRSLSDLEKIDCLKLIVIDSSFLSYQKVARDIFSRAILTWPFQWLPYLVLSDKFAPIGHIQKLKNYPLVVIHGKKDKIVPYKQGIHIYETFPGKKDLWLIEDGQHTDAFWTHGNIYGKKFFERVTSYKKC